jgi:anti-anti-sigma factor
MALTIESTKQGKAAVVVLSGRMDAEHAPQFESACVQQLSDGMTHILVDMTGLQYVSSMGIRSFVLVGKQAKAKGAKVLLCGMKGFVKEVFDMTYVTSLFPLFDSTEAALASL